MKHSPLGPGRKSRERGSTFANRKPRARPRTPPDVWAAVLLRDQGLCVWSRYEGRDVPAEHPHHLLPRQTWPQYLEIAANIVAMSGDAHMRHEFSPRDRLPWDALPADCQAFLTAVAAVDPRAARFVAVKYPQTKREDSHVD